MSFSAPSIPEPAADAIEAIMQFVFGSFFRFMIIFGVVLYVIAATMFEGVSAGHLGIYAATAITIGVVGRALVLLKFRDSY